LLAVGGGIIPNGCAGRIQKTGISSQDSGEFQLVKDCLTPQQARLVEICSKQRAFPSSLRAFRSNDAAFPSNEHTFLSNKVAFPSSKRAIRSKRDAFPSSERAIRSKRDAFPSSERAFLSRRGA
jgi:hypothetical protein